VHFLIWKPSLQDISVQLLADSAFLWDPWTARKERILNINKWPSEFEGGGLVSHSSWNCYLFWPKALTCSIGLEISAPLSPKMTSNGVKKACCDRSNHRVKFTSILTKDPAKACQFLRLPNEWYMGLRATPPRAVNRVRRWNLRTQHDPPLLLKSRAVRKSSSSPHM
jgi:hypothetical protein